jgi:hypothetical protein
MKKLTGWQKAGLVAGAGCATIIGFLVIGLLVAVYWARSTMAEFGDTAPVQVDRTIPLAALTPEAMPEPAPGGPRTPADGPSEVRLDLEEGRFTVEPGAPDEQVRVTGTFSPALYELTEDHQAAAGGQRRATVRFRSKAPAWARMLSGIGDRDNQPRITIRIPEGTPVDLAVRVAMGESRIDLGRLTVRDLDLDLSIGEHRIDFGAPVVERLRRLQLNASMGSVSVSNLGNARPQTVDSSGSMGSVTVDMGGAWEAGSTAQLSFTQSMGELRLNVPADVRLDADVRSGNDNVAPPATGGREMAGPDAPVLRVRVSSSMSTARINRYTR